MRQECFRAIAGLAVWLALCPAAHAQPADPPVHAGAQPVPPIRPGEPVLRQELDGRRAIRGCAADERCARPGDLLREFEFEAFPAPGASPWLDDRTAPASRLEPSPIRIVKRPSELRPDAAWLDQLDLPDLPVKWSQTLVDYLVFYRDDPRGRSIIKSWLTAQGRYRDMILAHLRRARLPEDLLYVAMIESGYDPGDSSPAGALGVWQFMPENARIYGLRVDRWIDERRDPLRSTIAQMDYFADLYQRFADWHIALAAFNMGYGGMLRSVARYNTNDYYRLCEYENAIPWETCLYTPKVLAVAIVGHNRSAFGFDKLVPAAPETWEEVAVPSSVSLAALARVAGASEADLKRLNPQLRHGRTPPGESGYIVRVPPGRRLDTERRLVELESDWKNYDAYIIAHGERFEDVATTFGLTVAQLRKLNDVTRDAEIEGGTVLVVPRITDEARAKNRTRARANLHASGVDQKDGELLIVPVPDKTAVVDGKRRVFYRVVAGDTLKAIAKALAVSTAELGRWNAIEPDGNLHPRMVLVAWVAPEFDADAHHVNLLDDSQLLVVTRGSPEHLDLAEARTGRIRTEYTAQAKEKLSDVARKFGMSSHDLARINRISYDTVLGKGQTIIVYQVADPARSKRADEQWKKTPRAQRGKLIGERAAHTTSTGIPASGDAEPEGEAGEPAEEDTASDAADPPRTAPAEPHSEPSSQAGPARPRQAETKKQVGEAEAGASKPRPTQEGEARKAKPSSVSESEGRKTKPSPGDGSEVRKGKPSKGDEESEARRLKSSKGDEESEARRSKSSTGDGESEARRSKSSKADGEGEARRSKSSKADEESEARRSKSSKGDEEGEARRSKASKADDEGESHRSKPASGRDSEARKTKRSSGDGDRETRTPASPSSSGAQRAGESHDPAELQDGPVTRPGQVR